MSVNTLGGYRHLVGAVLRREVILFLRYPINALGSLVAHTVFFGLIFVGGTMLSGQAMADSVEGIAVGYLLWMMATESYQGIATDIRSDANWGTLERHYLTPYGFGIVLLVKSVARLTFSFGYAAVLLVVMMLMTGAMLHIDLVTVLPITILALASVFGIGFALGGATVLYKNIGSWIGLLQFALVGLVAAPTFDQKWTSLLPLVEGSAMLQLSMRENVRLWEFDPLSLVLLIITGFGYLGVGYLVFYGCQQRARKLGTLGDY